MIEVEVHNSNLEYIAIGCLLYTVASTKLLSAMKAALQKATICQNLVSDRKPEICFTKTMAIYPEAMLIPCGSATRNDIRPREPLSVKR